MKLCTKCGKTKPLKEFCRHRGKKDGLNSHCRDCTRIANNRYRDSDPGKVAIREVNKKYRKTESGKEVRRNSLKKYYKKNPDHLIATRIANNAVRDGRLQEHPCVVCGISPAQKHHPDYSKPLNIVWLCPKHHAELHKELRKEAS